MNKFPAHRKSESLLVPGKIRFRIEKNVKFFRKSRGRLQPTIKYEMIMDFSVFTEAQQRLGKIRRAENLTI